MILEAAQTGYLLYKMVYPPQYNYIYLMMQLCASTNSAYKSDDAVYVGICCNSISLSK